MQREANYHELNHNCQHYVQRLAKRICLNSTKGVDQKETAQIAVLSGYTTVMKKVDEVASKLLGWEPETEEEIQNLVVNHFTTGWALKSAWDRRKEDC